MSNARITDALNRLFDTQRFSLADYLHWAHPWVRAANDPRVDVLNHIVKDHEADATRIAQAIDQRDGTLEGSGFPIRFTSFNDLSIDYLWGKLIEAQHQAITEIEACVADLQVDLTARSLAEEVLGAAKGHQENLLDAADQGNSGSNKSQVLTAVA